MKRHVFTEEDLYVGAKLYCMGGRNLKWMTTGKVYEVIEIREDYHFPFMITDDFDETGWSVNELNEPLPRILLYPIDRLTDQERFILELSGRLPDGL